MAHTKMAEGKAAARTVLIAGPTAGGKSALAEAIARDRNGVVINADAMQVYRELRVLTARPDAVAEAALPHLLYGHVPAAERYSVGRWLADVAAALAEAREAGRLPVIVGGTGLYFKALTEGLAEVPPIPDAVRESVALRLGRLGPAALHAELERLDPVSATSLSPGDAARVARALEVLEATGRRLAEWRLRPSPPLIDPGRAERWVVLPERAELHRRIEDRLDRMVAVGAIEEVAALAALGLAPSMPAMKAIGVRELLDYLAGRRSLPEALVIAKTATRRYAKRQETWLRHQMTGWTIRPS